MAEFDFILNSEDQRRLVEFVVNCEVEFVPALGYSKPAYDILTSVDDIIDLTFSRKLRGPFFILSKDFSKYPLKMGSFEKEGKNIYFIYQRHGGPYLDFSPSFQRMYLDPPILTAGSIGYYPKYWIDDLRREVKTPNELKKLYLKITSFIKSICVKASTEKIKRIYWIGINTLNELQNELYYSSVQGLQLPKPKEDDRERHP